MLPKRLSFALAAFIHSSLLTNGLSSGFLRWNSSSLLAKSVLSRLALSSRNRRQTADVQQQRTREAKSWKEKFFL